MTARVPVRACRTGWRDEWGEGIAGCVKIPVAIFCDRANEVPEHWTEQAAHPADTTIRMTKSQKTASLIKLQNQSQHDGMFLEFVSEQASFNSLRADWDRIYAADPHRTPAISWPFVDGWIRGRRHPWILLAAAKGDSPKRYVGFLLLGLEPEKRLALGGAPFADHTSMLCVPGEEQETISLFAQAISSKLQWQRFDVLEAFDPRLDELADQLVSRGCWAFPLPDTPCPLINLPDTWDQYIAENVGRRTRNDIRTAIRSIRESSTFTIRATDHGNYEEQMGAFLALHRSKWPVSRDAADSMDTLLDRCFRQGLMRQTVCWDGADPVGGVVSFIDADRHTNYAFLTAFNPDYKRLRSPGLVTMAMDIRLAISEGYQQYDLTRGGYPHKYRLGAIDRFNHNAWVYRGNLQGIGTVILRRFRDRLRSLT